MDKEPMDAILNNIDCAIKSGIEKAHDAKTFDLEEIIKTLDEHLISVQGTSWTYNCDIVTLIKQLRNNEKVYNNS